MITARLVTATTAAMLATTPDFLSELTSAVLCDGSQIQFGGDYEEDETLIQDEDYRETSISYRCI